MLKRPRLIDSGILLAYTIISVLMTWPITANLVRGRYLLIGFYDEYTFVWNFWWTKYSLADLHASPFYTNLIYYPFGTSLAFHTGTPFLGTLGLPITAVWGPEVTYNLLILTSFIFSAFTMYLLVNYLVKNKWAAFVAGVAFAFTTFKFNHVGGHLNMISTEFLPLYVLFFIKMLQEQQRRYRAAVFAGLCLGFTFLIDYYQFVYALFFSLCYLLYYLFGTKAGRAARGELSRLALTLPAARLPLWSRLRLPDGQALLSSLRLLAVLGVVFMIIGSPLLYADYTAIKGGYYVKWGGEDVFYADIASFFVPLSPLLSLPWVQQFNSQIAQARGGEGFVYLGWVVILLVAIGTFLLARRVADFRFWLIFMLLSFLFALGPQPHFFNHSLLIPGPFALWEQIPLVNNARVAARFAILVTFAAAVLVGYTLRIILAWLPRKLPKAQPKLAIAAFLMLLTPLMLLEHLTTPYSGGGVQLTEPAVLNQIATEPGDFIVMSLPAYSSNPQFDAYRTMYDQTVHHKAILNAFISRPLPDFTAYYLADAYIGILTSEPNGTKRPDGDIMKALTDTRAMSFYRLDAARLAYYLDVHYIIAHPSVLPVGALTFLSETLPLEQIYPDSGKLGDTIVYRVQTSQLESLAEVSKVELGEPASDVFRLMGWAEPETDAKLGTSFVWMTRAEGQIVTPVRSTADYTVTMNLLPLIRDGKPQSLSIYLNDETSPAAAIPHLTQQRLQQHTVTISRDHWRNGINKMRLQMSYAAQPGNGDLRTLSVAISTITFTPNK